jgi:DNA adenine methylase
MMPLLRWVGGKRRMISDLRGLLSAECGITGRFVEPFFGGGAVFFDLLPSRAILADSNPDLMHFYSTLAEQPDETYEHVVTLSSATGREPYMTIRSEYASVQQSAMRAAYFFYLNRCSFNGLWRVNSKGVFNVPYGARQLVAPNKCVWDEMSNVLRSASLRTADFRSTLADVQPGDLVFLDPPYIRASGDELFARYTSTGFGLADHLDLYQCVKQLDAQGSRFVLTISNESVLREMYCEFLCREVRSTHVVGGRSVPSLVTELVVRNFDLDSTVIARN